MTTGETNSQAALRREERIEGRRHGPLVRPASTVLVGGPMSGRSPGIPSRGPGRPGCRRRRSTRVCLSGVD